ncbi:MAG: transporter substrate-binding domain-containing protein [Fimbriimonadales bacterium]|nr:transporter substrate-binding domain-containing protein [Fimbriimonadales bacterium]
MLGRPSPLKTLWATVPLLVAGCGTSPPRLEPEGSAGLPPRPPRTLLAVSDEWWPYVGPTGAEREGFVMDLVRRALEPQGYAVRLEIRPWTRCLLDAEQGRADLVLCAVPEEAPGLLFGAEPVGGTERGVYVRRGLRWSYQGVSSWRPLRLAVVEGYRYHPEFDAFLEEHRRRGRVLAVRGEKPLERLIAAVRTGRADAVLENAIVMRAHLQVHPKDAELLREAATLPGHAVYVAVSPKTPNARDVVAALDRGLAGLRRTGETDRLMRSYGVEPFEAP